MRSVFAVNGRFSQETSWKLYHLCPVQQLQWSAAGAAVGFLRKSAGNSTIGTQLFSESPGMILLFSEISGSVIYYHYIIIPLPYLQCLCYNWLYSKVQSIIRCRICGLHAGKDMHMPRGIQKKGIVREKKMLYAAIQQFLENGYERTTTCLLYTSDAADE